jgi:hypothetical protein
VDAGYAYVVDGVYFVAHGFGGDLGFLGYEDVAGAGADYCDFAFALDLWLAQETDGAGEREVLAVGVGFQNGGGHFFRGAGDQHVGGTGQEFIRDRNDVIDGFAQAEDYLGHAVAQGAVVVYLGETDVFEGEMAKFGEGCVGIDGAGAHFVQEFAELIFIH